MKTDEALTLIGKPDFLDKIYNFSYHRCNTSHDAEELCSDIILTVLQAMQKGSDIDSFYGFVWTVARRVYADFSQKRAKSRQVLPIETAESFLDSRLNEIEEFIEKESEKDELKRIFKSIAFLSQAYRDVMIMYYLDGKSVTEISNALGVSEAAVKQRLFSARNTVRKEVKKMKNITPTLKPVHMAVSGTGNPIGNDPREVANRTFSQNLIYLCRKHSKTAKELSEELCVPMPYVEEELEIQCHGLNGEYGNLRRLENGRYISNIIVADFDEYKKANQIYTKHIPSLIEALKKSLEKIGDEILSFPFLSPQNELPFILWVMINRSVWNFQDDINYILKTKYFSEQKIPERPFSSAAVAYRDEDCAIFNFWGCDGIHAKSVEGYPEVHINNSYGKHFDAHFHCAHNISTDETLLMTIRAIKGLKIDTLTESEKEISAKAIECGYLVNNNGILVPRIVVMDEKDTRTWYTLVYRLFEGTEHIKEEIARELCDFIKANVPEHLLCEYKIYVQLIATVELLGALIDECVNEKLLTRPEKSPCAEGVEMIVTK